MAGLGVEWIAVGVVFAAGALVIGFPSGIAVGYAWRERVSRRRRLRYIEEHERRRVEQGDAVAVARPSAQIIAGAITDPFAKSTGKAGKRRKRATKPKLKVVKGDLPQEAAERTSAEQPR